MDDAKAAVTGVRAGLSLDMFPDALAYYNGDKGTSPLRASRPLGCNLTHHIRISQEGCLLWGVRVFQAIFGTARLVATALFNDMQTVMIMD